jgi:putative transposase
VGPVDVAVPRDREARFTPQIVVNRQRRLGGIDDLVISLTTKASASCDITA